MRKLPPKRRGELAEIRFLLAASSRGLTVAKPWGDSDPFDFLVERDGRYLRVQVKSTSSQHDGGPRYRVNSGHAGYARSYTAQEIDILAVNVVSEDKWFIIPIKVLDGVVSLTVSSRSSGRGRFDRYLDAWHLLRQ